MTGGEDAHRSSFRVSRLQRVAEERVFNPTLRWLLRSRLHWVVSRWLLLVSYVGRRSGRRYRFPVMYARWGTRLLVVTPESESTWWRNFEQPLDCTVWYHGEKRRVTGELLQGDERTDALDAYFEAHPVFRRVLDGAAETGPPDRDEGLAVVAFRLS